MLILRKSIEIVSRCQTSNTWKTPGNSSNFHPLLSLLCGERGPDWVNGKHEDGGAQPCARDLPIAFLGENAY